jgi:hypothetical protein
MFHTKHIILSTLKRFVIQQVYNILKGLEKDSAKFNNIIALCCVYYFYFIYLFIYLFIYFCKYSFRNNHTKEKQRKRK